MLVKLFLSLTNTPSIISFDKHSKKDTIKTLLNIGDGCCEYCLKMFIEDLILLEGINQVNANL